MPFVKPLDQTTVVTWSFAAARAKVFDALTRSEEVPRWFQPQRMALVTCEVDFSAGGSFHYVFQRPSGKRMEVRGAYQEVDAPRRWVYLESYDFSPLTLLVTTELDEVGGKTVLTQTLRYGSKTARDEDFDAVASSAAEIYPKLEQYLNRP